MNQIMLLQSLDKLAAVMRARGLRPITRLGRHLVKLLLKGNLSINLNDLHISGPIELRGQLYGILTSKMEPFMSKIFKDTVKSNMVVLDLGACLGYYSLLAAKAGAKVYAFEPDQRLFPYLVANIERNGFIDDVIAVPKAVSNKTGVIPFFLHDCPELNSLFDASGEVNQTVPVECITLDEFLDEAVVVDLIKMDIQGAELHALKGMERTIARASSHLTVFVECWSQGLSLTGGSAGVLVERLRELGFNVMIIDERNFCLTRVGANIESEKFVNLYCTYSKEISQRWKS
jgi:FkbM family methyltransferase